LVTSPLAKGTSSAASAAIAAQEDATFA